jgi:hypothetical protein
MDLFTVADFDAMEINLDRVNSARWSLSNDSGFIVEGSYDSRSHKADLYLNGMAERGHTSVEEIARIIAHEFGHGTVSGRQALQDYFDMQSNVRPREHSKMPQEINSERWVEEIFK